MHDKDCIFCKIAKGEIPSEKLYEDDDLFVIKDINPMMPVHLLIIPHDHVPTLNDLPKEKADIVGKVFMAAREMAKRNGIAEDGYRVLHNVNEWGGQRVFHMHFHLLGGKNLSFKEIQQKEKEQENG